MLNLIQHRRNKRYKLKLVLSIELRFQIKFGMTLNNIPRHAELDS
jgi:hypothetical protein